MGGRRGRRRAAYLRTDGSAASRFVIKDEQSLLGLAGLWGVAGEDARNGRATAKESSVTREVDVGVDVDEKSLRCHGVSMWLE